jgi:hypothetical protein
MRLAALLVTVLLTAAPALAQPGQASKPAGSASPAKDVQPAEAQESNLPVSLDKIREALQHPAVEPLKALKGLDERPLFLVEIRERQRIEELLQTLKFNSGPAVPGGLYGYEQQRIMFPPVDNPLAQPWSAFSQPQLARVAALSVIETLIGKYLAKRIFSAVTSAERASAERAAREEVTRAIADYCAAQPNRGAGIQLCASPDVR